MEVPDQRIIQNSKTDQAIVENPKVLQIQFDPSKVQFYIPRALIVDLASKELDESIDFRVTSIGCLEIPSAHQLFVEMPSKGFELFTALDDVENPLGRHMEFIAISWPYDRGKPKLVMSDFAYQVFEERPRKDDFALSELADGNHLSDAMVLTEIIDRSCSSPIAFDPGGFYAQEVKVAEGIIRAPHYFEENKWFLDADCDKVAINSDLGSTASMGIKGFGIDTLLPKIKAIPYDRGRFFANQVVKQGLVCTLVYDPGGMLVLIPVKVGEIAGNWIRLDVFKRDDDMVFVFDPGITKWMSCLHPSAQNSYLEFLKNGLVVIKPWMLQLLFSDVENSLLAHRKIWVIAWQCGFVIPK